MIGDMITLIYVHESLLINDMLGADADQSSNLTMKWFLGKRHYLGNEWCRCGSVFWDGLKGPGVRKTSVKGSNRVEKKHSLLDSKYLQTELWWRDTVWEGVRQPPVISCLGNPVLLIPLQTLMLLVCASFFVRQESCGRFILCSRIWFVSQNASTTPTNLLRILDSTKARPSCNSAWFNVRAHQCMFLSP